MSLTFIFSVCVSVVCGILANFIYDLLKSWLRKKG